VATAAELAAMRRAITLAERGLGTCSPNPAVGCVILDPAGEEAGEGFFERPGEPHAEVHALDAAGPRARGGTAVVTLEPCNHHGRTPPCRAALLDAGVARVVYAVAEPIPAHAGGAEALRAAGLEVEGGVLEEEAARGNEAWLLSVRLHRPFVTWKYAASLDGRVAARDGSSRWITGEEARADAHRLRARSDAVMVGSGTVRADDPQLTVRGEAVPHQPLRVVVDTHARTPAGARVLDGAAPTLVAVAAGAGTAHLEGRAAVSRLPRSPQGLDLRALLRLLFVEHEVRSVLLEGGPTLAGSFLAEGLVDRVVGYVAPLAIGGGGPPALAGPGAASIGDARRFRLDEVVRLGPDLRLTARPLDAQAAAGRPWEHAAVPCDGHRSPCRVTT
jgi:diaminohydroxyphosphoribosylaminopyrimidine deaminase / 5-amino-6-(5-phosphoribosylamino)uracil reductase